MIIRICIIMYLVDLLRARQSNLRGTSTHTHTQTHTHTNTQTYTSVVRARVRFRNHRLLIR